MNNASSSFSFAFGVVGLGDGVRGVEEKLNTIEGLMLNTQGLRGSGSSMSSQPDLRSRASGGFRVRDVLVGLAMLRDSNLVSNVQTHWKDSARLTGLAERKKSSVSALNISWIVLEGI